MIGIIYYQRWSTEYYTYPKAYTICIMGHIASWTDPNLDRNKQVNINLEKHSFGPKMTYKMPFNSRLLATIISTYI